LKILVSNDDGYRSRGIRLLKEALADIAEITVVAPDRNRSGASNSLTLDVPLRVFEAEPGIYYVQGTPTDCVHLAISGLFDYEHDMVVSGINDGANLGDDVLYSEPILPAHDPRGRPVYWVGPAGPEQDAGPGSDFEAIAQGFVSVTPLQIDLTRHSALPALQHWLEGIHA
jgi:5'-nucleotidase